MTVQSAIGLTVLALLIGCLASIVVATYQEMPTLEARWDAVEISPVVHVVTPAPTDTWTRYDVPLEDDVQRYISVVCRVHDIPSAIVTAIISVESQCDPDCLGDNGNSVGLMQIQPIWHLDRIAERGITDLQDPYQSVALGVDYLADLYATGNSTDWVLMAYNGGAVYATRMEAAGQISVYAQQVISLAESLLDGCEEVSQ